jgi:hypothetical protein
VEKEPNYFSPRFGFGPINITPLRETPTLLAAAIANVRWNHRLLFSDSSARCINLF